MRKRSFLYIDECLEGVRISINNPALMAVEIAGKTIQIKHIPGPTGVRGRNSENSLIKEKLGWTPGQTLRAGLAKTYPWIEERVRDR